MPRISEDSLRFRLRSSAFFTLFNLLLVWLLSLRYLPALSLPEAPLSLLWLVCAWLGGLGTLAVIVWLIPALLALVLKKRLLVWPCALLGLIGVGAMIVDTQLFNATGAHITAFAEGIPPTPDADWWVITGAALLVLSLFELWLAWRVIARSRRIAFPVGTLMVLLPLLLVASVAIDLYTLEDQTRALSLADPTIEPGERATPIPEAERALEARQESEANIDESPVVDERTGPADTEESPEGAPAGVEGEATTGTP